MKDSDAVSELDLALVHALQIRPRAAWSELAPLLGVSAVTLARRWERLTGQGLAWLSAVPGPAFSRTRCTAFVLVSCPPAARERLAARVATLSEAVTVELTAPGGTDLLLDVLAPDPAALNRFVTERLALLPDVTGVECLFATSLYAEGSRWRLGSLDSAQLSALGPPGTGDRDADALLTLDALDRELLGALVPDGRLGLAELALRTGTSAATVRRRLRRLTASGVATFRCDVAPALSGLPVAVTFRGRAPVRDVNGLHRTLATLPECRLVAAVTGASNVLATYWLRDMGAVQHRETALCARLPSLRITDRVVGVRTVKRMGHLLDADGRRTGTSAIHPW
ncbi:AsnC family transcriptional regulator [Streptomyces viridiviolaceus]|uniref:Lrp/AsnC family transcriptional regulator n=1 Tax=Streptomyces viridiviolaceus TaxID=68282 RepID=A0ABW2E4U8_9ACTN|nr:Lrp/AsnC family transcriptional regulator [Streptomyces viridiviolaceus]GHB45584.1 AsnC family transcriptional regulator [Streptomyces viridiviolaceus]